MESLLLPAPHGATAARTDLAAPATPAKPDLLLPAGSGQEHYPVPPCVESLNFFAYLYLPGSLSLAVTDMLGRAAVGDIGCRN